jgi:L-seryl-tRNA(Ser) seleniumtransferase
MQALPAMHRVLADPAIAEYEATLGRETVKRAVEREFDRVRISKVAPATDALMAAIVGALELERLQGLVPVINATGILIHTNLGRAPLAPEALASVQRLGHGYTNLEYDLAEGERGSRYARATSLICELTGAQDALVVNNCAAAVLLVLDTLAKHREVIVARSQLVEIGGGFRIPDVLERSGAHLREVGTTNKVRVADFESALCPQTALLLRVHPSNYTIEGFTSDAAPAEVAALGARCGVPFVEDLGSGALVNLEDYGLPHERTVTDALNDGAGLVAFSGDKLLGGPQCGILVGRANLIARLRDNPLVRALRVDKMTLAALSATLQLHRTAESRTRIPFYRMLGTTLDELRKRGSAYVAGIPGAVLVDSDAYAGGGSLPRARIASLAVALEVENPTAFAESLRRKSPAIVARIERDRLMFDLRTIAPEEDGSAIASVTKLLSR